MVSSPQQIAEERKMLLFQMEEAKWLDEVVRPLLPSFLKRVVEARNGTKLGRLLHLFVDVVVIGKILRLKVFRNQDTEVLGGKGFRPGKNHGYMIKRVHTTVTRRGDVFAKKTFDLNLIIRNNH